MRGRPTALILPLAALFVLPCATAMACGLCVFAMVERAFPPATIWSGLSVIWFVSLAMFWPRPDSSGWGRFGSIAIAVVAVLAGGAMMGPIPMLFLGIVAIIFTIERFRAHAVTRLFLVYTTIAGGVFLLTGIKATGESRQAGDVGFVIKWEGTGPPEMIIRDMPKKGEEGINELRAVVASSTGGSGMRAAGLLAKHGDPVRDVPLLIDALGRCRANADNSWAAGSFEDALRKLSGLDLPDDSTVEAWRAAWTAARSGQPAESPSIP